MAITKRQFERLAAFRHSLRCFLRHSEKATRKQGLTPQQYQLILAIKGYPRRDFATVGELAEQLQRNHHSVVELINRTEKSGLVKRRQGTKDRRQVFIELTPKGERCSNVSWKSTDGNTVFCIQASQTFWPPESGWVDPICPASPITMRKSR